ncbi:MAG: two pore domain potassium channel family protein [Alistipes sp.]
MLGSQFSQVNFGRALNLLKVGAGVVLLTALSWEILSGDHLHFSRTYLTIQLVVCLLFLADFFVRLSAAESWSRFFLRNILFFVLAIPYLNLLAWSGQDLPRDWAMIIGLMPLARAFLAFYIVVKWLADTKISRLFTAYIFTVVVFTYLSALLFYDYEIVVNPQLHSFGNALWWAWMNVTTVGAPIFAVTTIGKITTVLLPTLGMMMFPIFTTYIFKQYTHKRESDE